MSKSYSRKIFLRHDGYSSKIENLTGLFRGYEDEVETLKKQFAEGTLRWYLVLEVVFSYDTDQPTEIKIIEEGKREPPEFLELNIPAKEKRLSGLTPRKKKKINWPSTVALEQMQAEMQTWAQSAQQAASLPLIVEELPPE